MAIAALNGPPTGICSPVDGQALFRGDNCSPLASPGSLPPLKKASRIAGGPRTVSQSSHRTDRFVPVSRAALLSSDGASNSIIQQRKPTSKKLGTAARKTNAISPKDSTRRQPGKPPRPTKMVTQSMSC